MKNWQKLVIVGVVIAVVAVLLYSQPAGKPQAPPAGAPAANNTGPAAGEPENSTITANDTPAVNDTPAANGTPAANSTPTGAVTVCDANCWNSRMLRGASVELGDSYPSAESFKQLRLLGANVVNIEARNLWAVEKPYAPDEDQFRILGLALDNAKAANLSAIVSIRNGPGRGELMEGLEEEMSVYYDADAQAAWISMLKDAVSRLGGRQEIIAWGPMAAPSPENYFKDKTLKNSAPFWNSFAARMITAIRETGDRRLIVIEPVSGGRPQALWNLSRFWDTGVIYGVRMFEPRAFTMQAGPRFEYDYPGDVGGTDYDRQQLENIMKPLIDFKRLNSVPVFAEYGGSRLAPGMGDYIADLVSVFEANNISHAYYSWGPAPNGSDLFSVEYGPESDSSSLEIFSTTFLPVLRSWMMNPAEGKRLTPLNGVKTFAYLIDMQENSIKELAKSGYDMLVIDDARSLSDMTGYNMVSDVKRLKESHSARGPHKIVLAYMSIGEAEDYRWYWKGISSIKDLVLGDDPDGWDGNYLVKYWHPKWRAVVSNYVDMAVADGFDGVYLDWVAAYEPSKVVNAAGIDKKDAKEEMVRLVCDISQAARSKGLVVVAQNGADLAATPGYLPCIDGIAQEEIWYAGTGRSDASMDRVDPKESSAYIKSLKAFQQYGLPIFSIDYTLDSHNANDAYFRAAEQGYIEYVTMRDLNAMSATPPPELSE